MSTSIKERTIRKTLVAIEDEPSIIDLLGFVLETPLLNIKTCATGDEGLVTIVETKPDLILLDVMLPGLNGWEIYDYVRNDPNLKDIPILVLSVTQPESRERRAAFRGSPIDFYMGKPFDMIALRRKIEEMLGIAIW